MDNNMVLTLNIPKKINAYYFIVPVAVLILSYLGVSIYNNASAAVERSILFPVLGGGSYSNDYLGTRTSGLHYATDIFANKHTPIVAATDGTVTFVSYPQPSYGFMIRIVDADGYTYNYIHLNNDTPGTDDGLGDGRNAYAADIKRGAKVIKGQLLGWVGDSGNAETTPPHLHFEIYRPDNTPVNPYEILNEAPKKYVVNRSDYPEQSDEVLPFGPNEPGINLAMGNFDSNPDIETVVGAGIKGGPHVKIYKGSTFTGNQFFAYNTDFRGGVDVAAGDVDGDGIDEIITGAGPGGGPHVRVFKTDGTNVASFFAYDARFSGGVRVAAADVDGDGRAEIITGPGAGGGPNVKVFEIDGTPIASYFPYNPSFNGGVDVAGGDVQGDTKAEIVTAAGPGGGPHVRVMSYVGNTATPVNYLTDFFAYDATTFNGGVRVSVGNVQKNSAKSEILTVPDSSGGPNIKMFNGNGSYIGGKMFIEEWWYGFNDVAAGSGDSVAGTGINRRASIRDAF
jgi:Peptidase family M23/FG-GAP-like repeat